VDRPKTAQVSPDAVSRAEGEPVSVTVVEPKDNGQTVTALWRWLMEDVGHVEEGGDGDGL
jgi:hypothetical protein